MRTFQLFTNFLNRKFFRENKVGIGFDFHAFDYIGENENYIMLGGVKIPFQYKIKSHSDGDIILHAITDALLGTFSGGSIGQIFSDTDPQWKGCASSIFVCHALNMLHSMGGKVINVDVCVIAERPKIMMHADNIKKSLANIMQIDINRINIKATTFERLGTIGRGEGIAAQVVCMVQL